MDEAVEEKRGKSEGQEKKERLRGWGHGLPWLHCSGPSQVPLRFPQAHEAPLGRRSLHTSSAPAPHRRTRPLASKGPSHACSGHSREEGTMEVQGPSLTKRQEL